VFFMSGVREAEGMDRPGRAVARSRTPWGRKSRGGSEADVAWVPKDDLYATSIIAART